MPSVLIQSGLRVHNFQTEALKINFLGGFNWVWSGLGCSIWIWLILGGYSPRTTKYRFFFNWSYRACVALKLAIHYE